MVPETVVENKLIVDPTQTGELLDATGVVGNGLTVTFCATVGLAQLPPVKIKR